ncbi:hypothetical protein CSB11_02620 [Candidatus Campbellbacteria bacterium]|nr:MAG: hypothetical protein CSB11_02620 [Candidatus Campbellbacteria bacterium]
MNISQDILEIRLKEKEEKVLLDKKNLKQAVLMDNGTDSADDAAKQEEIRRLDKTLQNSREELRRARRALKKFILNKKTFGVCVDCNQKIPDARIEANPDVQRCVDCQEDYEFEQRKKGLRIPA